MNLSFLIARRYLFAKKSTNAINIIAGISVLGIAIGTAALLLVLFVFNGFEQLFQGMLGSFNPDIKIEPATGKTFEVDSTQIAQIQSLDGVLFVAKSLEEVALFEYKDHQIIGILKGVDEHYQKVVAIDTTIREGAFLLKNNKGIHYLVSGAGIRNKMSLDIGDRFTAVNVYMPKRETRGILQKQFQLKTAYPIGTFSIQEGFDDQYVFADLDFVRALMEEKNQLSALEIKVQDGLSSNAIIPQIQAILGSGFLVKNRYQQDDTFLKLVNIEKWMFFALFGLMLILVAFNMIGTLWMLVMEKKKDIAILKSMGMHKHTVRNIFLYEGLLFCIVGLTAGFSLSAMLYFLQKEYALVQVSDVFSMGYPMDMRWTDFGLVAVTVVVIGLMAALPAAFKATTVSAMIEEG